MCVCARAKPRIHTHTHSTNAHWIGRQAAHANIHSTVDARTHRKKNEIKSFTFLYLLTTRNNASKKDKKAVYSIDSV